MNVLSYPSPQNVNQWDEEWELGTISVSTGQNIPSEIKIRSKNYIPVFPSTNYYFKSSSGSSDYGYWYDSNKNFISSIWIGAWNAVKESPSNAYYLRFVNNSTTYNNDISINYPSTDTDYHAYKRNLVLTPSNKVVTLDGGVVLPDELGTLDLGSLNWGAGYGNHRFVAVNQLSYVKHPTSPYYYAEILCGIYETMDAVSVYTMTTNKTIALYPTDTLIVYDTQYDTAEEFKSAMNGVLLFYKKASS